MSADLTTHGAIGEKPPSVAAAVAKFAAAGLAAAVLLAIASFFVVREIATQEAIRDAQRTTQLMAASFVEPELTPGVLRGEPAAVRRFDAQMRSQVAGDPVERIKLWTRDGTVVYSDEPRLIGERFELTGDKLAAFGTSSAEAGVTDLSRPENRYDKGGETQLEVYEPIQGPGGEQLLFEAYQGFSAVAQDATQLWLAFAVPILVSLVLLALLQLPLAASLARRLQRGYAERERLLQRAVDASERERRRIAADIHDGVVQRLSGISYSLSASSERLAREGRQDESDAVAADAEQLRQGVRELRSLLIEIYPPSLERAGLEAALTDLTVPLENRGITARVSVDPGELKPADEALIFRVAQEAVRNAAEHAEASQIAVELVRTDGTVRLEVKDDGRGFDPAEAGPTESGHHMGIQLLRELAADAGAELTVESTPGLGTEVRLTLPAA